MRNKIRIILALTVVLSMTVSAQDANSKKKLALEEASAKLVELSSYITTMTRELVEKSAADPSFSQSEEFANLQSRITDLRETQNTTFTLIETLNEVPSEDSAAIDSIVANINIAYEVGGSILGGLTLEEVFAGSDEASSLTELLEESSAVLTDGVADVDQAGDGLAEIPNVYNDPSKPAIYQTVMNTLHDDFRESTTTPDGGGFGESERDATSI